MFCQLTLNICLPYLRSYFFNDMYKYFRDTIYPVLLLKSVCLIIYFLPRLTGRVDLRSVPGGLNINKSFFPILWACPG